MKERQPVGEPEPRIFNCYSDEVSVKKAGAIVFLFLSFVYISVGFDKVLNYRSTRFGEGVNAYVGGDAYNYIINSNYFGGYVTLALIFAVLGSTLLIIGKLEQIRKAIEGNSDPAPVDALGVDGASEADAA